MYNEVDTFYGNGWTRKENKRKNICVSNFGAGIRNALVMGREERCSKERYRGKSVYGYLDVKPVIIV